MSQPFLWGSQTALPAGVSDAEVTALSNGTFLVIGKTEATTPNAKLRGWIYNADGSLKEEKIIGSLDYGGSFGDTPLTARSSSPFAVELPDGRIALTWSITSNAPGHRGAWMGIYGSDLTPLGKPIPVAGLWSDPQSVVGDYKGDDAIGLADGRVIVTYRSLGGEAFLRVLSPNGALTAPLSLGSTLATEYDKGFGSVVDLAVLSDGNVVAAFRVSATENKVCVLDPSAAGGPAVLKEISIPVVAEAGMTPIEVTALEGGGFVVTWTESGRIDGSGSEPSVTARYQVFDAEGTKVTEPSAFYATVEEAESVGTPDVVALPGGGFALAAQVVTNTSAGTSEVRLAIFDAAGTRVSEKLLVNKPVAGSLVSLEGLSLLADGRIAALMSNGFQIVDPRDKAIFLEGTTGKDHYIGTAFNDTFEGSAGADILNGGTGIDYVSFAHAGEGVTASLSGGSGGDAAGDTYVGIEGLIGSSFNDVFAGNGSAILKGSDGDDTYYVQAGDTVEETAQEGRDTVVASGSYSLGVDAEVEVLRLTGVSRKVGANLTGSETANTLMGHSGSNRLKGQGGDDKLYGGLGNDTLYGGAGSDVFVFDTKPSRTANVDRIADFNVTYDGIWLDNAVFTGLGRKGSPTKPVLLSSKAFWKGSAAHDASDRIIYDKKTGALYYDKDGTGASSPVKIATLSKNLKLTYKDFFVV